MLDWLPSDLRDCFEKLIHIGCIFESETKMRYATHFSTIIYAVGIAVECEYFVGCRRLQHDNAGAETKKFFLPCILNRKGWFRPSAGNWAAERLRLEAVHTRCHTV